MATYYKTPIKINSNKKYMIYGAVFAAVVLSLFLMRRYSERFTLAQRKYQPLSFSQYVKDLRRGNVKGERMSGRKSDCINPDYDQTVSSYNNKCFKECAYGPTPWRCDKDCSKSTKTSVF